MARRAATAAAALVAAALTQPAAAFTLEVVGTDGQAINEFRWVLERDATLPVTPGEPSVQHPSFQLHPSHMPLVASGNESETGLLDDPQVVDPDVPHYISVRPESGYAMSGTRVAPGQDSVTVRVEPLPLPTAQISIFVFEDDNPINNAPDADEPGLEGFTVILEDAGGRYGHVGGQVMMDAFGNPLGTTYNEDGTVREMGSGVITTDADGRALIKNLVPAKYGVKIEPPSEDWVQTTTIEGTRTIDAWVKAGEPPWMLEFGQFEEHVFMGFVRPFHDAEVLDGGTTISGQVVNGHISILDYLGFHPGAPVAGYTTCWVGLNDIGGGLGQGVHASRCNEDGTFAIDQVPPGSYQLVIWDDYKDIIIDFSTVQVNADGTCVRTVDEGPEPPPADGCDLGPVGVLDWFGHLESTVFLDNDEDGFRDCVTEACDDPSRGDEVGLAEQAVNLRFRDGTIYQSFPTDTAGFVPFDEIFPFFNWLVAEVDYARMKATGATVVVDAGGPVDPDRGWDYPSRGKLTPQRQAEVNPNTGNAFSRTETGPVLTQAFQSFAGQTSIIEWGKKPYAPGENGGISGMVIYATTRAEDDPRYAAAEEWEPGIPRVQVNLYQDFDNDGVIDDLGGEAGPTLADVDNWPFGWREGGAKGPEDVDRNGNGQFDAGDAVQVVTTDSFDDSRPTGCVAPDFYAFGEELDCFDGLRTFNQVRPGVFDGGYAFDGIGPGTYIVEAATPRGYEIVREESKNVDFGETYVPSPELLPPPCVGEPHVVPAYLTFSRDELIEAPYANQQRPLCDRKQVRLNDGQNAAVDFFLYTETPVSARVKGLVTDDIHNTYDVASAMFGEKHGPAYMPVSFRDFTGREVARVYTDEYGAFSALVPSTYTVNAASPSGMGPSMLTSCINDPGPIVVEGSGRPRGRSGDELVTDPYFDRRYGTACFNFQYMPGTTTYLDTPVLPLSAHAGPAKSALDCAYPDGTPKIAAAVGSGSVGPVVTTGGRSAATVTLSAEGVVEVDNPQYGLDPLAPPKVLRDYGFGSEPGQVTLNGVPLPIQSWSDLEITAEVPDGAESGQLMVVKADGTRPLHGITLTVDPTQTVHQVRPPGRRTQTPIQDAIDAAAPGDIILLEPGEYNELVVMWKPVRLQGAGAGVTFLRALKIVAGAFEGWEAKVEEVVSSGAVDLLPGQDPANPFPQAMGPGILVLADAETFGDHPARIDGLTITGAQLGGGILVNGHADGLVISNNEITSNEGTYGGGVRIGHPDLPDADNDNVLVRFNHIHHNGGAWGAGGGVSVCGGSDGYAVLENFVCGNLQLANGAGIGHLGLSDGGTIAGNRILFNESFHQQLSAHGGGIYVGGVTPQDETDLSAGSGSVVIEANLIQGNKAGAGDGGGIRLERVNGLDLIDGDPARWEVGVYDNIIVGNVAGAAGGGVSLQDAVAVDIIHNTVAHNDSTATAADAFPPGGADSLPQPAGIVSHAHTGALAAAVGAGHSAPDLANLIVSENRSFTFTSGPTYTGLLPADPLYRDLGVLGTDGDLVAENSVTTGSDFFVAARPNNVEAILVPDEGGNAIDVRMWPLTIAGTDYHLAASLGVGEAVGAVDELAEDFDGDPRATAPGAEVDAGADEYAAGPTM